MHFRFFFNLNVQNWGYFWGSHKIQIFFGVLEIHDTCIFGG